jgi:hypothetical protein
MHEGGLAKIERGKEMQLNMPGSKLIFVFLAPLRFSLRLIAPLLCGSWCFPESLRVHTVMPPSKQA